MLNLEASHLQEKGHVFQGEKANIYFRFLKKAGTV